METRKPLKTTVLFIGIFLVGIIFVIVFISKALDTDHAIHTANDSDLPIEKVSQVRV